MTPTSGAVLAAVRRRLERMSKMFIASTRPDSVVVQRHHLGHGGRTWLPFTGEYLSRTFEAGLRTPDLARPFPEEGGSSGSWTHLPRSISPRPRLGRRNLLREGLDRSSIHVLVTRWSMPCSPGRPAGARAGTMEVPSPEVSARSAADSAPARTRARATRTSATRSEDCGRRSRHHFVYPVPA